MAAHPGRRSPFPDAGRTGAIVGDDFSLVPLPALLHRRRSDGPGLRLRDHFATGDDGKLTGGRYASVGSLEYNYRFSEKWLGALFVDAGTATVDYSEAWKIGTGVGVRWVTPSVRSGSIWRWASPRRTSRCGCTSHWGRNYDPATRRISSSFSFLAAAAAFLAGVCIVIWVKRIFLWLMGLFFLLLIGVSLLGFTHQGNKWLWQQARAALPSLKGELVAGQLGYGWTFEGVGWQDELVDVTVERAVLDWDLGKLLQGKLWIKTLAVTRPVVRVAESEPVPEEPSEPFVWHPLPLKIQVDSLQGCRSRCGGARRDDHPQDLDIGAALDRAGLIVRGPVLDGLNVVVAPSPVEAASDKGAKPADEKSATLAAGERKAVPGDKTQAASKPEPMVLPAVRLPFPIQLEGLKATAFRYQQGELVEGLDNLLLSATAEEERIDIRELSLRHAMADLALSGQVRLHEDYPSP